MRNFKSTRGIKTTCLLTALLSVVGCSKEINIAAVDPSWDRDVCERCKMMVSDKNYSAQIVDATNGKYFYFDDLGCALSWLTETKPAWAKDALVYANAADSGKWINVKSGVLAVSFITPMSFGIGVFESKEHVPNDKQIIGYDEAVKRVEAVKKEKSNAAHRAP